MDNRALDAPALAISVASAASRLGLSRASVYRLAKDDPTFPKIRRLGKRAARIKLAELSAWLDAQPGGADASPR
jgi:predicted DNA-binding transcriptional regulator AlpA